MSPTAAWFDRPMRWGQVNLKEDDPPTLEVGFWSDYWQRCRLDGVVLNAGGGVAYYPTAIPLHRRARFLGEHDSFGDLVAAARKLDLRVLARLDPNFGHQEMLQAHADWFLTDAAGRPRQRGQAVAWAGAEQFRSAPRDALYSTCWNSPHHHQFIPQVMSEIMQRYDVDGFFTNGWPPIAGHPADASMICHCPHCQQRWRARGHERLPEGIDFADSAGRDFLLFVAESIEAVQRLWCERTRELKAQATFVWNSHGGLSTGLRWERMIELVDMLDDDTQGRWTLGTALWDIGRGAKVMNALAEGRPVARIIGVWHTQGLRRRHTAKTDGELTLLLAQAAAHGQRLWWHHLGGSRPADSRWMDAVATYFRWHAEHERYFRNVANLAQVGLLWSPRTLHLERWGALDGHAARAQDALLGWYLALLESRIAFALVPDWKLRDPQVLANYRVVVVPSTTALDDAHLAGLAAYAAHGGALVVGADATLLDRQGRSRGDLGLAPTLGVRLTAPPPPPLQHAAMRIADDEAGHPILAGIEQARIVTGGTHLSLFEALPGTATLLTLVPSYPTAPPEKVYMDPDRTDQPLIGLREKPGRSVYLGMDLDAGYWQGRLCDQRRMLAGAVRWAAGAGGLALHVEGPGLLDVAVWRQEQSIAVHLVNLNTPNLYGGAVCELLPAPAQIVRLSLPAGTQVKAVRLLAGGAEAAQRRVNNVLSITVPSVLDHEIVAIDLAT